MIQEQAPDERQPSIAFSPVKMLEIRGLPLIQPFANKAHEGL